MVKPPSPDSEIMRRVGTATRTAVPWGTAFAVEPCPKVEAATGGQGDQVVELAKNHLWH